MLCVYVACDVVCVHGMQCCVCVCGMGCCVCTWYVMFVLSSNQLTPVGALSCNVKQASKEHSFTEGKLP